MVMHKFSEKVAERWSAWELRTLMLISLLLQIFLAIFGNRRKYMGARRWLGPSVWLAYLLADTVAVFSLGIMSCTASHGADHSETNSTNPKYVLVFWAPILLIHLGGPDTITAYSIEDNELWLRHLLTLLTQVGGAFYVSLKLWNNKEALPLAAILIFVVGLYKYGERTWALWLASSKKLRASIMESEVEDDVTGLLRFQISKRSTLDRHLASIGISNISDQAKFLYKAQVLFEILKPLISNLLVGRSRFDLSKLIITSVQNPKEAFGLIEVEVGFVYDMLYTKMTGARFLTRIVLRSIGFLSTISALVAFSSMMRISKHDKYYSKIDIVILCTLLVGAILLEIYSTMVLLFSDWTMVWISRQTRAKRFHGAIWSCPLRSFFNNDNSRWSGSMAQHDIFAIRQHLLHENRLRKKWLVYVPGNDIIQRREKVSVGLKEFIFIQLSEKRCRYRNVIPLDDIKQALEERGDGVLRRNNLLEDFGWSTVDLEFHHSLLTWHIATGICYWEEFHKNRGPGDRRCGGGLEHQRWMLMSKSLSDYMMYLLADPDSNMLPKGIGRQRYSRTSTEILGQELMSRVHLYDLTDKSIWDAFYEHLLQRFGGSESSDSPQIEDDSPQIEDDPPQIEDDSPQIEDDISELASGVKLARSLIAKEDWSNKGRWEMMSKVWVEMLTYAACHGEWKEHAQSLTRGGELLTHVYLISTHLGFSVQRVQEYNDLFYRIFRCP